MKNEAVSAASNSSLDETLNPGMPGLSDPVLVSHLDFPPGYLLSPPNEWVSLPIPTAPSCTRCRRDGSATRTTRRDPSL